MKDVHNNRIFANGSMIVGMRDTTIHEDGVTELGTCLDFAVDQINDEAIVLRDKERRTIVIGWGLVEAIRNACRSRDMLTAFTNVGLGRLSKPCSASLDGRTCSFIKGECRQCGRKV